jgi:hypothetical protein
MNGWLDNEIDYDLMMQIIVESTNVKSKMIIENEI